MSIVQQSNQSNVLTEDSTGHTAASQTTEANATEMAALQPKVIAFTIPRDMMASFQLVNLPMTASNSQPSQGTTSKSTEQGNNSTVVQHNERKLLKRPKTSSPTTESRKQAEIMNHIQELQTRSKQIRRSRKALFSGSDSIRQQSLTDDSPVIVTSNLTNTNSSSTTQAQESALQTQMKVDPSENWVLVATGQTEDQLQVTKQAQAFLSLNPSSPHRRIAVVPLLRMNITSSGYSNLTHTITSAVSNNST